MATNKQPSYSGLVFRLAWANTWLLIKDRFFEAAVTLVSFGIGLPLYLHAYGKPAVIEEGFKLAAFVLIPAGAFLFFAFLWNLCLASDQLVYDAIKDIPNQFPQGAQGIAPEIQPTPINWAIWRERSKYTFEEFAKILAKVDPIAGELPHEAASYQRLLIEEAKSGKIRAVPPSVDVGGKRFILDHSNVSELSKTDAVAWAESKGFAVDHIT